MTSATDHNARRLMRAGILLFFIGLVTGFGIPMMENPRMGLASHLEAVLNGIFLLVLGLLWHRLTLGDLAGKVLTALAIYGGFANWLATLLAALLGAGSMMTIAAAGYEGTPGQEMLIGFLLLSLSAAMLMVCLLVLWGLRNGEPDPAYDRKGRG